MATGHSAGSAFVRILPSLTGFRSALRTELRQIHETVKVEVEADTTGLREQIRTACAGITGLSVEVTVRVDLDGVVAAAAAIAALQAQLNALGAGATDVRIRLDSRSFLGELANIQTHLNTIAGGSFTITAETRQMMEQLADVRVELQRLEALEPSVTVDADTAAARAQIAALEHELARIAGRQYTAKVDVDKDGAVSGKILALGAAALYAIPALGSLTTAAASLAASLASVAGAAPVAVGALAAFSVVSATVKAGTVGMDDAFTALAKGKMDKFAEALEDMSGSGRAFAVTIKDLTLGPWADFRKSIQEPLFAGFSGEVQKLSAAYLPTLRSGMTGIAQSLNGLAKDVVSFATSAQAVGDVDLVFKNTRSAVEAVRPAAVNLLAAFLDLSVVGSAILPEMSAGLTESTDRFREFIAEARQSGQLEVWIRGGLDTLRELGSVAGNVGGILGAVFTAANASGADFLGTLDRATGALDGFLHSADGQNTLVAFFTECRAAIDAITPGLEVLGRAVATAVAEFSDTGGLTDFGDGVSVAASAVAALIPVLGTLAGGTLGALGDGLGVVGQLLAPLVTGFGWLLDALGPLTPVIVASALAFFAVSKAVASVATALLGLTGSSAAVGRLTVAMTAGALQAGVYTEALLGSAAAGSAVAAGGARAATAVGAFARALPAVAIAAIAVGVELNALNTGVDKGAQALLAGGAAQKTYIEAQDTLGERLLTNTLAFITFGAAADAVHLGDSTREAEALYAAMSPLQKAQTDAARALNEWNLAVQEHTANSPQARAAADLYAEAMRKVGVQQDAVADLTRDATAAVIEQQRAQYAATDADLAYQDSLARIAEAQDRAAEAARNHGAGSREAEQAARDVLRANLDAAAAAGVKAEADAKATGASNAAEIGARAQKDELIRLAGQATGPTRDALLNMANGIDLTKQASNTAEIQARLHKDELGRLAGQATGPLATAINTARQNFDTLGGANATAEQKAKAQKDELQRLANMASGPLRTELQRMADQIKTLPDGSFVISAKGELAALTNHISQGGKTVATGGILPRGMRGPVRRYADAGIMPGYTPGRDVHRFVSPTAGVLELSGGEPVMRPEFGRAVGAGWIHAANAAARAGGVAGVEDFLGRSLGGPRRGVAGRGDDPGYAGGGILGRPQRFALGGLVRTGTQPLNQVGNQQYIRVRDEMVRRLAAQMAAERKKYAASGGPLGGGGGQGWQWQMRVLRERFPGLQLISGFRPGAITATGNRSYHASGRAVDIPPRMDVFNWIRGAYGGNTKELIFSPAGGAQVHNGRPHVYTGITKANHYCVPMDTAILTRRGWMAHDQIVEDDETPGFNPATGRTEWTRITAVTTFDDADIVETRSHSWSVRSTANHRWVARDHATGEHYWCTTDGERSGEHAPTYKRTGRRKDTWVIAAPLNDGPGADLTAEECELLGWFVTDGSHWTASQSCSFDGCENPARGSGLCGSHRRQARAGNAPRPLRAYPRGAAADSSLFVWQTKPVGVARLRALLGDKAGYNGKGFRVHGAYATDFLTRAGLTHVKDPTQLMPLIASMTSEQRAAMLEGIIGGDGLRSNGKIRIMQNAGPLLDVITTLAYYCGYRTTVAKHKCSPSCWPHNGAPMVIYLGKPRVSTYRQGRPVVARAQVWCPTTELGSWTARFGDNVVLTGNSHVHWAMRRGGIFGDPKAGTNVRAHLADRGGMVEHGDAALNLSGKAERYLTDRQNVALERLVDWATSTGFGGNQGPVLSRDQWAAQGAGGDGRSVHIEMHAHNPVAESTSESTVRLSRTASAMGAF